MNRNERRRLARLEQTAGRLDAERKQREAEQNQRLRRAAWDHLTMVVAIVVHGEPRIDEPLEVAWRRTLDRLGLTETDPTGLPDQMRSVLAEQLPGDNPMDEFAQLLSSAPPWILSFCRCSLDFAILGIPLKRIIKDPWPEPSEKRILIEAMWPSWPSLPGGVFESGGPQPEDPVPEEREDPSWLDDWLAKRGIPKDPYESLDADELLELWQLNEKGEESWTRLERLRYREIMAKVRRAHPEMDPSAILRKSRANDEND